jgi:hypothetical protein
MESIHKMAQIMQGAMALFIVLYFLRADIFYAAITLAQFSLEI